MFSGINSWHLFGNSIHQKIQKNSFNRLLIKRIIKTNNDKNIIVLSSKKINVLAFPAETYSF